MQVTMVRRMMACGLVALCAGFLLVTTTVPTLAQEHGHHDFHGRDVHHFDRFELGLWRGGGWRHEFRNGRLGWWWVVGGVWYYYDAPVYPYPGVVSEMAYPETVVVAPPPSVIVPGAPMVMPAPPSPQQPQMWYYCDNPAGYYPYVPTCSTPFRPVPASPQ